MSANRGKYAEGKVAEFLTEWKRKVAGFTFNRVLDAHASKGSMSSPQPGDFQWFLRGTYTLHPHKLGRQFEPIQGLPFTRNGLIEVKEVEHTHRLPYKNFETAQVGRMQIREMAGSEPLVLIAFRAKGQRGAIWRSPPLSVFAARNPQTPSGSWDLYDFDAFTEVSDILIPYLSQVHQ